MDLLLDTHVLIWLASAPDRLSKKAANAIKTADRLCLSVVSAWEYGIKRRRHPRAFQADFDSLLQSFEADRLDLRFALHRYSEALPPIHHDPFDRMLIAQAMEDNLALVSADSIVRRYPVETIW